MEAGDSTLLTIPVVCNFLIFLFKTGYSSSYLNSARSALSFFCLDHLDIGNNLYIQKLFKFFYRKRPLRAKYLTFWPVSSVINFLKEWHPFDNLSLKMLTLKTLALVALSCSDRGQTLHLMNIRDMEYEGEHLNFIINSRVKNTRKYLKPKVVKCICTDNPHLNVASYVSHYIDVTKRYRGPNDIQLFISWKTHKPVSKQTISRWLTSVLKLSGINTDVYQGHSFRGAGLSKAFAKGASLPSILAAGDWKQVQTFKSYYCAPSYTSSVGQLILSED